jgi:co-chaperonin GroES (HSP10)
MLKPDTLLPINEWILVEDIEPSDKSKGGIYLPKQSGKKELMKVCKVLAISPDVFRTCEEEKKELRYAVGDIVVHHSQMGVPLNIMDEDDHTMLLKYDAVMGLVQEEEK